MDPWGLKVYIFFTLIPSNFYYWYFEVWQNWNYCSHTQAHTEMNGQRDVEVELSSRWIRGLVRNFDLRVPLLNEIPPYRQLYYLRSQKRVPGTHGTRSINPISHGMGFMRFYMAHGYHNQPLQLPFTHKFTLCYHNDTAVHCSSVVLAYRNVFFRLFGPGFKSRKRSKHFQCKNKKVLKQIVIQNAFLDTIYHCLSNANRISRK